MAVFAFFIPEDARKSILRKLKFSPIHWPNHDGSRRPRAQARQSRQERRGGHLRGIRERYGRYCAPVFNRAGEIAAACVIAGPIERMRSERERYVEAVKTTTAEISAALGWATT